VGDVTGLVAEQAQGWLAEAVAALPEDVRVRTHVRTAGSVPEGLLDAAAEFSAAAVVVGAGGGTIPFGVGPVARTLLHSAPLPVVLVPRREPPARIDQLYVAVGARQGARAVLEEAWEAAVRTGLPLHVVSLVELDENAGADTDAVDGVRRLIDALVEDVRSRSAQAQVTVEMGRGRTMAEAVDSIDWAAGGLLLVGSSRLAQGRQTFLGPTAARMLRHVPVPVVVVPRGLS
jgi:nucleotide-binding universal stress UspA family protein